MHHKAADYDVGIYFEANGHGTVLFSTKAIETFRTAMRDEQKSEQAREAAKLLYALTQLINQAIGDAISDMLMVEVILLRRQVYMCMRTHSKWVGYWGSEVSK